MVKLSYKVEKGGVEMKCPYCNSEDYEIMYINENKNALWGILVAFILFVIGTTTGIFPLFMIGILLFIACILTIIINKCNSGTLKVRCTKCNQKYKISKGELKK